MFLLFVVNLIPGRCLLHKHTPVYLWGMMLHLEMRGSDFRRLKTALWNNDVNLINTNCWFLFFRLNLLLTNIQRWRQKAASADGDPKGRRDENDE